MLKRKNFKSKSSNRLGIRILKKNLRDKMTAARPVPEPPSNVVEVNHFLDKLQEYLQNTNPSCWDGRTVIQEVHIRDYVDDMGTFVNQNCRGVIIPDEYCSARIFDLCDTDDSSSETSSPERPVTLESAPNEAEAVLDIGDRAGRDESQQPSSHEPSSTTTERRRYSRQLMRVLRYICADENLQTRIAAVDQNNYWPQKRWESMRNICHALNISTFHEWFRQ